MRTEIELVAQRRSNWLAWAGLGLMSVQFGILARLTWWEYSWDIMEPVTYFVTYGTAMACYAYYVLTKEVRKIMVFYIQISLLFCWINFLFMQFWLCILSSIDAVESINSEKVWMKILFVILCSRIFYSVLIVNINIL